MNSHEVIGWLFAIIVLIILVFVVLKLVGTV